MSASDLWREFIANTDFDALADDLDDDYSDLLNVDHKPTEPYSTTQGSNDNG
jgi:hypothetical protein